MIGPEHAITLRPEAKGDGETIHRLTEAAFAKMPFSDGDEADLIDHLRAAGELTLSLVAEDAERIVGHIAFSPVTISDATISDATTGWYGLGPVSVWPELQGKGIGSALIRRGITDLRVESARGIVLLGNPEYYSRFGFEHDPELAYPGPPAQYFQRLVLDGEPPRGTVRYSAAFEG